MHQISSDSSGTRSFNELKNKMSAEAKEQVDGKVEGMMAELGHLDQLDASEVEVDEAKRGTQILPDHLLLRAETPRLNNSSASLLREGRNER